VDHSHFYSNKYAQIFVAAVEAVRKKLHRSSNKQEIVEIDEYQ
jgi:hypothetical protein